MSLPAAWVERIFEKMVLVYGQEFLRRWENVDLAKVKADWSHELAGFAQAPGAIGRALASLPDRPPTVLQFRQLVRDALQAERPAQLPPPPPADPARVNAALAGMQRPAARRDPRAWAWELKAREEVNPRRLTRAQRQAWRVALCEDLSRELRIAEDEDAAARDVGPAAPAPAPAAPAPAAGEGPA